MSVKLIILGLLMNGEKHPYEMQHIMKMRKMDKFVSFYKGSLYYAVEQLKDEGLIEVSQVIKEEKRPDKTVYKITEAGKNEFQDLLMQQMSKEEQHYDPLYTALVFARYGDSQKIAEVIKQKIKYAEKKIEVMEKALAEISPTTSRAVQYIYRGLIETARAEKKWLQELCADALENRLG
ncbi:DNA-binding PadR family transcriptional regulator [Sporomusaceae bacterium BoRhaA]|uniref:PadR family transcriptional regulator n=1 Tax=Pelorhabdus rhamnosifermentans TaxID=2772457 RepID=UPI001C063C57|nr:PadR family transcriptional regulator [Pelorhabdus rhamnosifermentans]MBU2699839.1 DNA-binding PadR family transcriptional regulator [Pelorhabdus rhamnosifermentans]